LNFEVGFILSFRGLIFLQKKQYTITLPLPVSSSEFSENAHSFFRKFVSRTIFKKNVNGSAVETFFKIQLSKKNLDCARFDKK